MTSMKCVEFFSTLLAALFAISRRSVRVIKSSDTGSGFASIDLSIVS